MGRWKPNARARLEQAALELYAERGYALVTVAEIAARAGLTERTFFRHFADKREVLFGNGAFIEAIIARADAMPTDCPAMQVVIAGLLAVEVFLVERHAIAGQRWAIIQANVELQEREVMKLAALAAGLANALRRRGTDRATAQLAAETGVAIFKVAFDRWVCGDDAAAYPRILHEVLDELRTIAF